MNRAATMEEVAEALLKASAGRRYSRIHPETALRVATALRKSLYLPDREQIAWAICSGKKCSARCADCSMRANAVMQLIEGQVERLQENRPPKP